MLDFSNHTTIIAENQKRLKENSAPYNAFTGEGVDGCGRTKIKIKDFPKLPVMWLPNKMLDENKLAKELKKAGTLKKYFKNNNIQYTEQNITLVTTLFYQVRFYYDFEFWAYLCTAIKEYETDRDIQFVANRGQRRIIKELYRCLDEKLPIRFFILKCRRLGSSTVINEIINWFQLVRKKQWNSVICSHVETTAQSIRGMTAKIYEKYPYTLAGLNELPKLLPYQHSQKTRYHKARGTKITTGSFERPEGVRGGDDIAMALLSEVGLWKATKGKKPEDMIQAIISGIPKKPETMIVYESTAKGVGNYFHREYIRTKNGDNGFVPIFIFWYEIDHYQIPIDDYEGFLKTINEYEKILFQNGATLEAINWYRQKKIEYSDEWRFMSEFPSTDTEAFQTTGRRYYPIEHVEQMRKFIKPPAFVGDIAGDDIFTKKALENVRIVETKRGNLSVWKKPDTIKMSGNRYVVVVDINKGLSESADNGIICVIDRYWQHENGIPEIVAEWCGKVLIRELIWKAAQLSKLYHNAHLVVESNTKHNEGNSDYMLDAVFDEIKDSYSNLYCDTPAEQIREGVPVKWGFRTSQTSKHTVCSHQQWALAQCKYIERSEEALNELNTFEQKENGKLEAVDGCRDDRHITRAIGIWVCYQKLPAPQLINTEQKQNIVYYKQQPIINQ